MSEVATDVVVLFDGFNNVAFAVKLQQFFGEDHVVVRHIVCDIRNVAQRLIQVSGVAESTLVIGHGPGWGCHDTQVVIHIRAHRGRESHLRERSLGSYTINCFDYR